MEAAYSVWFLRALRIYLLHCGPCRMYEKGKQMNKQWNALAGNSICCLGHDVCDGSHRLIVHIEPIRCLGGVPLRANTYPQEFGGAPLGEPPAAFHCNCEFIRYQGAAVLRVDARKLDSVRNLGIISRSTDRNHHQTPAMPLLLPVLSFEPVEARCTSTIPGRNPVPERALATPPTEALTSKPPPTRKHLTAQPRP